MKRPHMVYACIIVQCNPVLLTLVKTTACERTAIASKILAAGEDLFYKRGSVHDVHHYMMRQEGPD